MTLLSRNGTPLKAIGLKKALNMMHLSGTRLVRMASADGSVHYLVPGGYVAPETAEKIKNHPGVVCGADGLFPGHDQTWRMDTK